MKEIQYNKAVSYEYFILDTLEVGIELKSYEIKQIIAKKCNIKQAFCKIVKDEMILFQMNIEEYPDAVFYQRLDPQRDRRLLMHKKQIKRWKQEMTLNQNITIVPQKIYLNEKGKCKLLISLVKGKKLYDKRESIRKRDIERHQ